MAFLLIDSNQVMLEGGESTYDLLIRSEVLGTPPKNILQFSANESSSPEESSFTRSPMRPSSQRLLASPKRSARKISRTPFKMLEAPGIQDDFYLNLVDWSSRNILAVGLNSSVYLWNAATGCTEKMMELPDQQLVTSVRWVGRVSEIRSKSEP
jgi:cell division cycle 20-like protein 1, cofactor of APC complex